MQVTLHWGDNIPVFKLLIGFWHHTSLSERWLAKVTGDVISHFWCTGAMIGQEHLQARIPRWRHGPFPVLWLARVWVWQRATCRQLIIQQDWWQVRGKRRRAMYEAHTKVGLLPQGVVVAYSTHTHTLNVKATKMHTVKCLMKFVLVYFWEIFLYTTTTRLPAHTQHFRKAYQKAASLVAILIRVSKNVCIHFSD